MGLENPFKAEDRTPALTDLKRLKQSLTSEPRSKRQDRNYKVFSRQKHPPVLLKRQRRGKKGQWEKDRNLTSSNHPKNKLLVHNIQEPRG